MSLAPSRNKSPQQKYYLKDIFGGHWSRLGVGEILAPDKENRPCVGGNVWIWRRLPRNCSREGGIIIVAPQVTQKLGCFSRKARREFFFHLSSNPSALLIFAQCDVIPDVLAAELRYYGLSAAASPYHENLLFSRIKAIIREKIQKIIVVHGVALEMEGAGVLIVGPSGIGKTTAVLNAVSQSGRWIADDRVVVKRNTTGDLTVSGHPLIKRYFHTEQAGIECIDRILDASQRVDKAKLRLVIEAIRQESGGSVIRMEDMELLDIAVPRLRITVSETGYFNENLLQENLSYQNRILSEV